MFRRLLPFFVIALTLFGLGSETLQAQVQVDLKFKRRLYMAYEPIIATVSVRNLSGRDLPLADAPGAPWFTFQVLRSDNFPVPPTGGSYNLAPMVIPAGETIERRINITPLYPMTEYGLYRIRAAIYFSPQQKYFESPVRNVEISEGKTIWQQTVGIPDGQKGAGETRTYSLLEFRRMDSKFLYVRVTNPETGDVYMCSSLGRLLGHTDPQAELDIANTLHILQVTGPKVYLHTQIGPNGEVIGQETHMAVKNRPRFRRDGAGLLAVVGGVPQSAAANQALDIGSAEDRGVPKISDRPVNLPRE